MEVGWDVEGEVAHRALRFALVEVCWLRTAQTPCHDLTQHPGARPVEACGEVVHFCPRQGVQAGICAND
jgi:hypothetical protein